MPLEYFKGKITRQLLRDNPDKLFLFGDNDFRHGYGGQAAEMRGEPNAIGIRTKRYPRMRYDDFWYDKTYEENTKKISEDFDREGY